MVAARERRLIESAQTALRGHNVGKIGDEPDRELLGRRERAPGRAGVIGMHDIDALAREECREPRGVAAKLQRIEAVVIELEPFAAGGTPRLGV